MKQLRYWCITAGQCGVYDPPLHRMKELGYKVTHAVPQTIGDQWWFTVEEFIEPLPPYLEKTEYDINTYQ